MDVTNEVLNNNDDCDKLSLSDRSMNEEHIEDTNIADQVFILKRREEGEPIRASKRDREETKDNEQEECENGEEWITVNKRKEKKMKAEKMEIYISCNDKLPKQFELARTFKNLKILEINKIKYLSPYKIKVECETENCMLKLINCQELIEKGWKFQKAFEVNFSYGVIKNVDGDLSEEEILSNIDCADPAILTSVRRLSRLNEDGKWVPSETVRLCFKKSYLPPFVSVYGLKIKVEPFVFPVSQCSKCWKFGHTSKRCPTDKIVCPKCGEEHENCTTMDYKCVNCGGQHMALNKTCPIFTKEKKIRQLMSDFNVTYRKARTMYVSDPPPQEKRNDNPDTINNFFNGDDKFPKIDFPAVEHSMNTNSWSFEEPLDVPSYSSVLKKNKVLNSTNKSTSLRTRKGKMAAKENTEEYLSDLNIDTISEDGKDKKSEKATRDVTLWELLMRLKEIIFLKRGSLKSKVQDIIKCCVEWLMLIVVENIAEWPVLTKILEFLNSNICNE
ncbi:uncharacterized protein LOC124540230 [Vanessa cardui]|uniref:uncharacterized protein LOC124540230 n=1 Tax=Vanessa cardui TaxID=171605 RepID=UPI001F1392C3|nr:uncharacterized protein LOC124540230 [Vanessa cardui]